MITSSAPTQESATTTSTALAPANRATGPITAAGKAIASRNATRYGIFAAAPVVASELPEEWEEHLQGIVDSFTPVGRLELELAERVALLLWRLRRVARYETDVTNVSLHDAEADAAVQLAPAGAAECSLYIKYIAGDPDALRCERNDLTSALSVLESLPTLEDTAVLDEDSVTAALRVFARTARFPDERLDEALKAGLGRDETWHAPHLRRALDFINGPRGNHDQFLPQAIQQARRDLEDVEDLLAGIDAFAERLRHKRVLAPPKVLARVMRYEAGLNRLLITSLHELEALQRRRTGDPTPLARVTVTGDTHALTG